MGWGKFIGTAGLFGAYDVSSRTGPIFPFRYATPFLYFSINFIPLVIHAIRNGTILAIDPTLPSQSLILEKMNAFSIFCFSPLQKLNQLDIY